MNSTEVKNIAFSLGADLCGIASLDRFKNAPEGYHPLDVLPTCKSVVSAACRFPVGTLICKTPVPYTRVRNSIAPKMDAIALDLCIELEKQGVVAIPIAAIDDQWDEKTKRTRSIVSQKHAAEAAGLGSIGRHSLLITPEYGSMVWLASVLTDAELEADPMTKKVCNDCGLCVAACPVNALENKELNQKKCWEHAFGDNPVTKDWQISCHKCRDICPFNLGTKNKKLLGKD